MRARTWILGLALVATLAPTVRAEWFCNFLRSSAQDFRRRNCWGEPFITWDRASAEEPFAGMICRGWEQQNLLGDHHFREGTADLTEAGRLKIRWIVLEAPEEHRAIYVHRGPTEEETQARLAAVQQCAAEYRHPEVSITPTDVTPYGWPAERIDTINRKYQSTTPDPVLPKDENRTANGG